MTGQVRLLRFKPDMDRSWMKYGLCRHVEDPNIFFPEGPRGLPESVHKRIAAAKAICAECPVQHHCLEYALGTGQTHGVWGGTTERERKVIVKRQRQREALGR
jgi:WhiB family redox-sensing transcriptional regulator